jgi:hypothetical protein
LQFRLGSLIVVMVVCAIGFTWWRQWKLTQQLSKANSLLAFRESQVEILEALDRVNRAIDLADPKHRELFELTRQYGSMPDMFTLQRQTLASPDQRAEVLLFHRSSNLVPSFERSLAVLMHDNEIVDFCSHETSTRNWSHEASLYDSDNDGNLDVVIRCSGRPSVFQVYSLNFAITADGFGPGVRRSE